MFEKIRLVRKILKLIDDVQKVIDKNRVKFEEEKKIIEKAENISPEIKAIVQDIFNLFK